MRVGRWLSVIGAPILFVLVVTAGTPYAAGAILGVALRDCPRQSDFRSAVSGSPRGTAIAAGVRLSTVLDSRGAVSGRSLSLMTAAGTRTVALAGESFASAPVANVVIFGESVVGGASTVRAIDLQTGCQFEVLSTRDVVRSAVIDQRLSELFLHTVSSATRADLGVTRLDLATSQAAVAIAPLSASDQFGPTFATLLRWSDEGDALAVQSCGIAACRTRVLQIATSAVENYSETPLGEIVSLDNSAIRAFEPCEAEPCGVVTLARRIGKETRP